MQTESEYLKNKENMRTTDWPASPSLTAKPLKHIGLVIMQSYIYTILKNCQNGYMEGRSYAIQLLEVSEQWTDML